MSNNQITEKTESNKPPVKAFDAALREAFAAYRERNDLDLAALGVKVGSNSTQVSRYLSGKPTGDVEKMEKAIRDVLKNEDKLKLVVHDLFITPVSLRVKAICDRIKETGDVGLIFGPPGEGKSSGIALYEKEHATTIVLRASQWTRTAKEVERALWEHISTHGYTFNVGRSPWMVNHLRGSGRLIMVDDAHQLATEGLLYLFNFSDATGCPLGLAGNESVMEKIQRSPQMHSRVGVVHKVELTLKQLGPVTRMLLDQLCPAHAEEIHPLALAVAEQAGRLRAVRKQVRLMLDFLAKGECDGPAEGFQLAHKFLIRDYKLGPETAGAVTVKNTK